MVLNLAGEVDYKMFESLVKSFNESKGDVINFYFSCPEGGSTDVSEAIVDLINKNKEKITATFYGDNFSAGMYIFLKLECEKRVLPDTKGMYHYAWQEISIKEGGKPSSSYDTFCMKEMKNSKSRTIDYLKTTKLNDKEIRAIKSGKDVYFSYQRMQELL